MVIGDEYTVPVTIHHLEADAMARLAYLIVIGMQEVRRNAVNDIRTDQPNEWTTSLRDSLKMFADIIKEPNGRPLARECDSKINFVCDECEMSNHASI
jgi:hypothetical protein